MFLIADNIRITKPAISRALAEKNPLPVSRLVRRCLEAGVHGIDISTGPLGQNFENEMAFFVDAVQNACDLKLFIDTSNARAMEKALSMARQAPVINGISIQEKRFEEFSELAIKYDCMLIVYLLSKQGQVLPDSDSRLSCAVEIAGMLESLGIEKQRLIFDPVCVPLNWEEGPMQFRAVKETLRLLPEVMGTAVNTVAGISNLTSGLGNSPRKLLLEEGLAAVLVSEGLNHALVNALNFRTIQILKSTAGVFEKNIFSFNDY